jgi:hypothetical protein
MNAFGWSLGQNRYENVSRQFTADTLRQFAVAVLSQGAISQAKAGYVCVPLGGDGIVTSLGGNLLRGFCRQLQKALEARHG